MIPAAADITVFALYYKKRTKTMKRTVHDVALGVSVYKSLVQLLLQKSTEYRENQQQ